MITIGIDPILISLGSFSLSWHGLFMAIAIVVGVWLSAHLVAKAGLPVDRLYSLALCAIPGDIVGARLVDRSKTTSALQTIYVKRGQLLKTGPKN